MQGNDIAPSVTAAIGIVFDGLMAEEHHRVIDRGFLRTLRDWRADRDLEDNLDQWEFHPTTLASLRQLQIRLGDDVRFEIYTFRSYDFAADLERYLGDIHAVWVTVKPFKSPNDLARYVRMHVDRINTVLVPTQELQQIIGLRARVVAPNGELTV